MTYYGSKELASSFRTVRKNTIQVATEIPEDQYGYVAAEGTRSVAQMLVHVALAPKLFWQPMHEARSTDLAGFDFFAVVRAAQAEEAKPWTKAGILDLLTREGEGFARFLESMSEADLAAEVSSPTGSGTMVKSRFEMLLSAKEHEMHHRAQLMLVERQLGIVPHPTRHLQEMMARARG